MPHHLFAFLLAKVLDENPEANTTEPEKITIAKIRDQYWEDTFWDLRGVFVQEYFRQWRIPFN